MDESATADIIKVLCKSGRWFLIAISPAISTIAVAVFKIAFSPGKERDI